MRKWIKAGLFLSLVLALMALTLTNTSKAAETDPLRVYPDGTKTHYTSPPGWELTCECGGILNVDIYYWDTEETVDVTVTVESGDGSTEGSYDGNTVSGPWIVTVPNAGVQNEPEIDPATTPHADHTVTFPVPTAGIVYYRVHVHLPGPGAANLYFSVTYCPPVPEFSSELPAITLLGALVAYMARRRSLRK